METIEENKLIAEFMGGVLSSGYWLPDQLKYHSSWDWLMPVVERIGKMGNGWGFFIADDETEIFYYDNGNAASKSVEGKDVILNTWQAVIKFIEWFNQGEGSQWSVATESKSELPKPETKS